MQKFYTRIFCLFYLISSTLSIILFFLWLALLCRIIRHNAVNPAYFGHTDKFRIQLYDSVGSGSQPNSFGPLLGKKVVESVLLDKRPKEQRTNNEAEEDNQFAQISQAAGSRHPGTIQWQPGRRSPVQGSTG